MRAALLTVTAPRTRARRDPVVSAGVAGIAAEAAASGAPIRIRREGVLRVIPKVAGTAWSFGDPLYYADGDAGLSKVSAGKIYFGFAGASASSDATTGTLVLVPSGPITAIGDALTALTTRVGTLEALKVPRVIYAAILSDTTATTSLETVRTVTIPAGLLASDGDRIEYDGFVTTAINANNKTVAVYFNSHDMQSAVTQASAGNLFAPKGAIIRVSATLYRYVTYTSYVSDSGAYHSSTTAFVAANANSLDVKFTTPTLAGDATLRSLIVTYYPAVP